MDIERSLLSKLVTSEAITQCWDQGLRSEVFETPIHAEMFDYVIEYWMANTMSLAPTKDVIRWEYEAFDFEYSDESLTWLIDKLQRRYKTNTVQQLMRDAAKTTSEDPAQSLDELFDGAWKAKNATAPRFNRVDMADNIQRRRERYSDRQQQPSRGAPIGLTEVDDHTGGILPGELAVVAGYAKTGKSFALVKAIVEARRAGFTPCAFTLEQAIPEFEDRIDCFASGVGYGTHHKGLLTMEDTRRLHAAQEEMAEYGPLHLERPGRGERTVANIVNRARQVGADYLIIDQLSWLETRGRYRERRDQFQELIYDLKEEISRASSGELPTFMAVQYNRQAVATKGERGTLQNIANAADIEQTVDIAYGLYRNREIRANNSMILDILGARRSDEKSWLLGWELNENSNIFVRSEFEEGDA